MSCLVGQLLSFHKFIILYADDGEWWLYKSGLEQPSHSELYAVLVQEEVVMSLSSPTPGIC